MKRLLAAIQFLTLVPVPGAGCDPGALGGSVPFFPVVGLLIGGLVAALDAAVGAILLPLPASVLVVIGMLAVSGGLHLDGLADTADGFLSARPRDRILEIMRDSHVGAMGVVAIVSVLTLKIAALASVPAARRWSTLILMPTAGRCAMVLEMALLPCARPGGLAAQFAGGTPRLNAGWALGFLVVAGYLAAGTFGLSAAAAACGATLAMSLWCHRKIGGFTGDTLGATCELAELLPAVIAAVR